MEKGYFVESSNVGVKGHKQTTEEQAGIKQYAPMNFNEFVAEPCLYDMGSVALRRMRLNRSGH
ncbi:MAG: hypothetical protein US63_C0044G0005 [Candidatus Moranbacteria bacterium GW2011_GWC2_37_8]|nr:MAG: hypothetical protein US63_C0044G0005 [Candidatus Moranbacteria bacterium GW2011_GWC2_37_8]KKQ60272.1 MAG: hypothetical protein US82_C0041G0004 [Parcubacteria group bacterium GW2011_GWC1_38_22]KKQ79861.1 MAG: hypothetical protein UT03_C0039G0003 [Candidatus Moranbacteria bacterium GW2011_GWD2_38_7]